MEMVMRYGLTHEVITQITAVLSGLHRKRGKALLMLTVAILGLMGISLARHVYAWREAPLSGVGMTASNAANNSAPAQPPSPPRQLADDGIHGEVITILPQGFDPKEIIKPKGHFILLVDNHSGVVGINLRLDQQGGARLADVQVEPTTLGWTQTVDLPAGTYLLTEANHPNWVCRITVKGGQ
jgi:hypothetical protein